MGCYLSQLGHGAFLADGLFRFMALVAVAEGSSGVSIVIGIRFRFCGHILVEVFIDRREFGQCEVGPQRCVRQGERQGNGGLARELVDKQGVAKDGPEREAFHAMEQYEADAERAFHGFTEPHVDKHEGAEPYECCPCHDGLRCEGECHYIGCRDSARHIVAVHIGGLHEACILRHGNGASARCSCKGGGEVLGEHLALGTAGASVLRYIEYGALCLDGDIEFGAYKVGVVDGVGHIHTRLDTGVHAEWGTEPFCQIAGKHLRGCARALDCIGNHKSEMFLFRPSFCVGRFTLFVTAQS